MPWKECNPMDERLKFIARLLDGDKMAGSCHVKQVEAVPLARREGLSYWNHSVRLPFVSE